MGLTVYDDFDKYYTSIKHYYRKDGQLSKIFEGSLKKMEQEDDNINMKDFKEQYLKHVKLSHNYIALVSNNI